MKTIPVEKVDTQTMTQKVAVKHVAALHQVQVDEWASQHVAVPAVRQVDEAGRSADGFVVRQVDETGRSADGFVVRQVDEAGRSADGFVVRLAEKSAVEVEFAGMGVAAVASEVVVANRSQLE
jgi:hypothetical protein